MNDKKKDRFAYTGLERIFHEKARLSVMTSLYINHTGADFNELKVLCGLTDGNLSRHLDKLATAGLIKINKTFDGNYPKTTCSLTKAGREGYQSYVKGCFPNSGRRMEIGPEKIEFSRFRRATPGLPLLQQHIPFILYFQKIRKTGQHFRKVCRLLDWLLLPALDYLVYYPGAMM